MSNCFSEAQFLFHLDLKIERILTRSSEIMAKLDAVKTEIDALKAAAANEKLEVKAILDALKAQVTDLADQLANAGSQEEIDALVADLKNVAADIDSISTVGDAPATEVPVEAPVEVPADEVPVAVDPEVPAETPAEPVGETPADSGDAPVAEVPAETPAEAPAEAPATDAPVEAPTDPLVVGTPQPILP